MGVVLPAKAANVNDFYFEDFTGDYYLTKDSTGVSHLKVVENVTAVFPDYNQNKGICRQIPFTNKNDTNVTLPDLNRSNLVLLRNGQTEPIYSIEKSGDYYNVCTGTEEYVKGKQVYTFEYEFEKVVTEYDDYQELYWDANGNGATQRFDKVTARVHFDKNVADAYAGKEWCYVGSYGSSDQTRCTIAKIDDGLEFTANDLTSHENLTYDIELKPGSFTVPAPDYNYAYVWILVLLTIGCVVLIAAFPLKKFLATKELRNFYKDYFIKPEYQPDDKYSLAEMAEVYLGHKKDAKVAMLLEMIVQKKVSIIKGEGKDWKLKVNTLDGVPKESETLLEILNGGNSVKVGEEIEIKKHTATSHLVALNHNVENHVVLDLEKDKLVEKGYKFTGTKNPSSIGAIIVTAAAYGLVVLMLGVAALGIVTDFLALNDFHGIMVFQREFTPVAMIVIFTTIIIWVILSKQTVKFKHYTIAGLKASRYMDGLKLYISMVEADRLKFLQSVKGVDTSADGIVKLYEKLLPYAAVFGLEESWMEELGKYCEVEEVAEPDWLTSGITAYDISRMARHAAGYATASSVMVSSGSSGSLSGGGSWSSGFSGGGGGGFSGGGGGGGGFSGR